MQRVTRRQAIRILRQRFLRVTDDEHSMCDQAARLGIYCGGFGSFSLAELKRRYYWIAHENPDISRDELQRKANIWQLGRQDMLGTKLCCDTQTIEHDTCRGWDEHSDDDLARWVREFTGQEVEVTSDLAVTSGSCRQGGTCEGLAGVAG
ncbi:MAG: hypothetical protein ACYTCU_01230 [Planctomycetota bacterium]|jgi:hypothetical protein